MNGQGVTLLIDWILVLSAYILGSIPWGVIIGRASGVDLTRVGSGSTGGTNAVRALGPILGVTIGLLDISKAALASWLAVRYGLGRWVAPAAGIAAVIGHNYSAFLGFRGGKGVAASIGVCAVMAPAALIYSLPVGLLVVALSRLVSLGSLVFIVLVPLFMSTLGLGGWRVLLGVILAGVVFIRHIGNIQRLFTGVERRLGER